jgi:hypothetical protein
MNRPTMKTMLVTLAMGVFLVSPAETQGPLRPAPRPGPKLEPVAETKLLMEGLAQPNFRALEKLLKQQPADKEAWVFARGQSLLIAETANLLMIRPPRNTGQDIWMDRATAMRDAASSLARNLAKTDLEAARTGLGDLANACTRCHKSFRVPVKIVPFAEPGEGKDVKSDPHHNKGGEALDISSSAP